MKMTSKRPRSEGYWWVWDGKADDPSICEVYSWNGHLMWSFIDGLTGQPVNDRKYMKYKWARIQTPSVGKRS